MRRALLAIAVIVALDWATPAAVGGDAVPAWRGGYVYPRNRPILNKYPYYYYVNGQLREGYYNYYAATYPRYDEKVIRGRRYRPDYSTYTLPAAGYWYWVPAGSSYSPY